MVSYNDLFRVCVKYTAQNYYVGDVIPQNKLANARKRYPIPEQERVVALIDTTIFGSAKTGLAVGETGLHWRNANTQTQRTYMSWGELSQIPIVAKGVVSARVEIGQNAIVELAGSVMGKDDVLKLLSDIQHLIRSPASSSPPPIAGTDQRWALAVNGRQYGPYDLPTIRGMLVERQIDPNQTWAWQEGWRNWMEFTRVPPLAALLHDALRTQTAPPPTPVPASPAKPGPPVHTERAEKTAQHPELRSVKGSSLRPDLNRAPVDELLSLPGMTLANGQRLLNERERRGGFNTAEEVGHFLDLKPHQIERLKQRALIEPYEGARRSTGRVIDF